MTGRRRLRSRTLRSPEAAKWHRLYSTARWKKLRLRHLAEHPLCAFCLKETRVTAATIVDHVKEHKGDLTLFHDPDNLQSLCPSHHSSDKALIESRGYSSAIGSDGHPLDPLHPWNRRGGA